MVEKTSSIINKCFDTAAERIAAYRVINNRRFSMEELIEALARDCASRCPEEGHVLCIQDTTETGFSHTGRLSPSDSDFGTGTDKHSEYSIFAHPVMVIGAQSLMPVGLAHTEIWNRDRSDNRRKSQSRSRLPLEEKESYRWAEAAKRVSEILPAGVVRTMVADRESDIYTVMCITLSEGGEFLIRSTHDRSLEDCRLGLVKYMEDLPVMCEYDLPLRGHKGRKPRTARMALRFSKVTLSKPANCLDNVPESLTCYCILAVEDASTVPEGEKPVEWRLLTSHRVETAGEAMQCVEWYKCRWFIEELFRVCKSEGFRIESVQLESGAAVKKLIVLTLYAALRCVALKRAYDEQDESVPADVMFDSGERDLLSLEMDRLHKLSPKAQDGRNPFREGSLPWAAWIIARLGGWSGQVKAHGRPGYITMKRGLDRFQQHLEIISFAKIRDVYKE